VITRFCEIGSLPVLVTVISTLIRRTNASGTIVKILVSFIPSYSSEYTTVVSVVRALSSVHVVRSGRHFFEPAQKPIANEPAPACVAISSPFIESFS
jgi:hypothetical protein